MNTRVINVELSDRIATVEHIATDQGNGGAYCGNCNYILGSDPLEISKYKECPSCNYRFGESSLYVQQGGSDF